MEIWQIFSLFKADVCMVIKVKVDVLMTICVSLAYCASGQYPGPVLPLLRGWGSAHQTSWKDPSRPHGFSQQKNGHSRRAEGRFTPSQHSSINTYSIIDLLNKALESKAGIKADLRF